MRQTASLTMIFSAAETEAMELEDVIDEEIGRFDRVENEDDVAHLFSNDDEDMDQGDKSMTWLVLFAMPVSMLAPLKPLLRPCVVCQSLHR